MTSKTSRTTNFSEQEKLLLAELGKDFPVQRWKARAMAARRWQHGQKHGEEEILTLFNSQIPNGIKRDLSQLQGCWRRLKLHAKKEHDLQRREVRKTGGKKLPPPKVK